MWSDVIVSDGALSQAVRTLRRALDDNPREPRFIRTVSRHGYQFVWPDVVEEILRCIQRELQTRQSPLDAVVAGELARVRRHAREALIRVVGSKPARGGRSR